MSKSRKTVAVKDIKSLINGILEQDTNRDSKICACCILEEILHRTGNYKGFGWNMSTEEAKAVAPQDETYFNRVYY